MAVKLWSEDLGAYVEFKDGTSEEEMERLIRERLAQKDNTDEEDEIDVWSSLKHGLKSGYADLVNSAADYQKFGSMLSPVGIMNEAGKMVGAPDIGWGERVLRDKMRQYAGGVQSKADEQFQPEGFAEEVLSGVGQAPGAIAGMAPAIAGTAIAAPAAGPFAPAIGFGIHGAVRNVENGPIEMAKGGALGAAEGLAFGKLGEALSPLKSMIAKRLLHGTGAAAIGGGSSAAHQKLAGQDIDPAQTAADATVMGLLGLGGVGQKRKSGAEIVNESMRRKGVEPSVVESVAQARDRAAKEFIKSEGTPEAVRAVEIVDGMSFVDVAKISEAKGSAKPPETRTNYEKLDSPLAIDEIGWRELQGMAPEKQTVTIDEMIGRAREVNDFESATNMALRFAEEYSGGKLAGIGINTKKLAQDYNKQAAMKRLELDKAEADAAAGVPGAVDRVRVLATEYEGLAQKGMGLVALDSGYGAEFGRALRARREMASRGTATDEAIFEAQRSGKLDAEMYDRIIRAQSQAERDALVKARFEPKLINKLHEAWIMGMLSNPLTWAVNLTSNTAKVPLRWSSEATAVFADKIMSLKTGKSSVSSRDNVARLYGALNAAPHIMSSVKDMLTWKTFVNDLNSPAYQMANKMELHGPKIGGNKNSSPVGVAAGSMIRTPGRVLQFGDAIFRTLAEVEEAYVMASERSGKSASMKDISKLAKDLLADPDKSEVDMSRIAKAGDRAVWTESMGQQDGVLPWLGRGVQSIKTGGEVAGHSVPKPAQFMANVMFPFTRTPTNIMIDALRHSPFGLIELGRMMKNGASQREIASQMGSIAIGSAMMGISAYWARQGVITGGGPVDPVANSAWRDAGNQPYSIKIGDKWVSYQRVEPFSSLFGAAADLSETWDLPNSDELVGKAMSSIKDNLTNKTYMMGFENLTKAWADPKRYGENYLETLVSSLIPAAVGTVARGTDPIDRTQSGPVDAVKGRIPGLRQTLDPRYKITGDISQRENIAWNSLTPFTAKNTGGSSIVAKEISRLIESGYSVRGLPRRSKNVNRGAAFSKSERMTKDEYAILMDWTRKASRSLEPIMSTPSWSTLSPEAQVDIINSIFDGFRKPGHYEVAEKMRQRVSR